MVICDLFELNLSVRGDENPIVDYLLHTDLPAGTRVILSVERTYLDASESLSLWGGDGDELIIMPSVQDGYCGCSGSIDVVASDKQAYQSFKEINREFPPGISTPVSDLLTNGFTVGARQRLREFGRMNANLSGPMVMNYGEIHVVVVRRELLIPMKPEF